jgi:SlyX protein
MESHDGMDRRLTELEIKASFQEDLLDQLNQVIVRQQRDIAQLVRDVDTLRQQAQQAADAGPGLLRDLRDELPPHY